jgi:hypothetical protein
VNTDTERLEFMYRRGAEFGSWASTDDLGGIPITEGQPTCRVPCQFEYSHHVYARDDWRDAIDAAMLAPTCTGELGACDLFRVVPRTRQGEP